MKKEEKNQLIDSLKEELLNNNHFYLADTSNLNVEVTNKLRRLCFNRKVQLKVVKNTLLKKAMEKAGNEFESFHSLLEGPTSIMFSDVGNLPAKIIKDFSKKYGKPVLKGAYVEDMFYIGADQLDTLVNIKSKNEIIGDIIGLLQSPSKNIILALQSGGSQKIIGIIKTLSEKSE